MTDAESDLRSHSDQFKPIAITEIELGSPIPTISALSDDGVRYGSVRLIVRLHSKTVGTVDVDLAAQDLPPRACAEAIWVTLGPKINAHLRSDLLPEVERIDDEGLPSPVSPPCLDQRAAALLDPPPVSVVICTRNRADLLARTLASFEALEYPNYELLVVDGSHSRQTADVVQERFPNARYFHVGDHGRSFALNRGISAAQGSIVAFTDDDVRVDAHWLAELVAGFDDRRVACVTGIAFPMELRTQAQVWFEESGGFTEGFESRTIGLDLPAQPGSLLPFATGKIGAGVNMAWRRELLREIDGFDLALDTLTPVWPPGARHSSSGEDLSAFFDALVRGYILVFQPSAIVFHEHRRTYEELERQIYWHGIGLSAHLTRSLLAQPKQIPAFLRRIPQGVVYGFGTSSIRNDRKSADFPSTLTRAEWLGVVTGPLAYLKGLPRARRIRASLVAEASR